MSDPNDRDRGRPGARRRKPRGGTAAPFSSGPRRKEREYDAEPPGPARTPIILAKPNAGETGSSGSVSLSTSPTPQSRQAEKPMMVLKSREDQPSRTVTASTTSLPSIPVAAALGETTSQPSYHIQRAPPAPEGQGKIPCPPDMTRCVKLVDGAGQWSEAASELLLDQTDFLVVGVLGLQGSGKSTVMSLLAGSSDSDPFRSYVFSHQNRDLREECAHQTTGIDIFVTSQRIVFLDTQPILSPSVLDHLIQHEKKLPPEYTMAENWMEMQGLQLATFLFTVCNVVLVVQDWFADTAFLRFIQTAEMLKPSSPSSSHDGSSGQEDVHEYYPHLVFLQNKASREDFSPGSCQEIQQSLAAIFTNSKLKMTGVVTMPTNPVKAVGVSLKSKSDFNLFMLPHIESRRPDQSADTILTLLPEYKGHPSFSTLITSLRSQIYSLPRDPLTHTNLSEKNWFHYAARTWDSIRKSPLMSEYSRLLP